MIVWVFSLEKPQLSKWRRLDYLYEVIASKTSLGCIREETSLSNSHMAGLDGKDHVANCYNWDLWLFPNNMFRRHQPQWKRSLKENPLFLDVFLRKRLLRQYCRYASSSTKVGSKRPLGFVLSWEDNPNLCAIKNTLSIDIWLLLRLRMS